MYLVRRRGDRWIRVTVLCGPRPDLPRPLLTAKHFVSCTFSILVALYYWARTIQAEGGDPLQAYESSDDQFFLAVIRVERQDRFFFPTIDHDISYFAQYFLRRPVSAWKRANASCEAVHVGKIPSSRIEHLHPMPVFWMVMGHNVQSVLKRVMAKGHVTLSAFCREVEGDSSLPACWRRWTVEQAAAPRASTTMLENVEEALSLPLVSLVSTHLR